MERLSRVEKIWLVLLPAALMSMCFHADEMGKETLLVLFGDTQDEEPAISIVQPEGYENLVTSSVRFPEDLMRFIECCNQDTIRYHPVQSYLSSTNKMSTFERVEEEKTFNKMMQKLQVKKRKLIRKWSKSSGIYRVIVNLEICSCIINDPNLSFNRLDLLKVVD